LTTIPEPVFTREAEAEIALAVEFLARSGMSLSMVQFVGLLKQLAATFGFKTTVSENLVAGFFRRHADLARKRPQILEESRAVYFSEERVKHYQVLLKDIVDGVPPSQIYNMDECGLNVEKLKARGKVVTVKYLKGHIPRYNDRTNVTLVACANA
jgi:hypothetical protein